MLAKSNIVKQELNGSQMLVLCAAAARGRARILSMHRHPQRRCNWIAVFEPIRPIPIHVHAVFGNN